MKQDQLVAIDTADLVTVTGGNGLTKLAGKAVEWGRHAWNAAAVGMNILNPTSHPPVKTIPSPPRIERPAPARPGVGSKAKD